MPTINPDLVPSIAPGTLFSRFTTDTSINIRWLTALDPVYFEALNRPLADIALRQLILAKTLDNVNLRLGHQALFPFLIQPQIGSGSVVTNLPLSWIWDMQVSMPQKWDRLRLAKVKRVSGHNLSSSSPTFTGVLRLVFTAVQTSSASEVALFEADYHIDSTLTYQIVRVRKLTTGEEPVILPAGELATIDGFLTFRTLDPTDISVATFYNAVPPPVAVPTNSAGEYTTPTVVSVLDTPAGSTNPTNSFDLLPVSHGTGLITLSAWNPIPAINSDIATWVDSFNYPFDANANLLSATVPGLAIPRGLFKEFNLVAPASDNPTNDVTGTFFPVFVNRIHRDDVGSTSLTFFFATYNLDSPSIVPVEFASLTVHSNYTPNQIVSIVPSHHLFPTHDTDPTWNQDFGRGHVMLSDLWGTSVISAFFSLFLPLVTDPPDALFVQQSSRISSFGISRVPRFSPTQGQAQAMRGSRDGVAAPSNTNRYVVESDQGIGDQVDFGTNSAIPESKRQNPDIERFGFTGSLAHRLVSLIVDASGTNHDYDNDILPRLRILLGRDPVFGDEWWDGTRKKFFNGDLWIG